jgi:hypothetical protein
MNRFSHIRLLFATITGYGNFATISDLSVMFDKARRMDSSLLGVGCDESQEVLMGVGKHGEQGADGIPAPLTPALAWRSSRIPAEPYPPASNSIVSGMTLAVKR